MEDKKQTDKKKGKNYGQSYSMEGSGSIDALKSTMEHLHWYEGQFALRKEEKPGTAALAAIAACFGVSRFDEIVDEAKEKGAIP